MPGEQAGRSMVHTVGARLENIQQACGDEWCGQTIDCPALPAKSRACLRKFPGGGVTAVPFCKAVTNGVRLIDKRGFCLCRAEANRLDKRQVSNLTVRWNAKVRQRPCAKAAPRHGEKRPRTLTPCRLTVSCGQWPFLPGKRLKSRSKEACNAPKLGVFRILPLTLLLVGAL